MLRELCRNFLLLMFKAKVTKKKSDFDKDCLSLSLIINED